MRVTGTGRVIPPMQRTKYGRVAFTFRSDGNNYMGQTRQGDVSSLEILKVAAITGCPVELVGDLKSFRRKEDKRDSYYILVAEVLTDIQDV